MTGDSLLDTMLLLGACSVAVFLFVGVPVAIREWWEDRRNKDDTQVGLEDQRRDAGCVVEESQPAGVRRSRDGPTEQFTVQRGDTGSEDATEPLPITTGR
jgi:hypothetical protein